MAVLPTPGSPIRTGLFFVRRERIWITRRISSSRPITGSRRPARADSVRSRVNSSRALPFLPLSFAEETVPAGAAFGASLIFWTMLLYIFFGSTPTVRRMRSAMLPPSRRMPISRCSVPIIGEPMRAASDTASSTTPLARGVSPCDGAVPARPAPTLRRRTERIISSVRPYSVRTRWASPSSSRSRPSSRCSEPT